MHRLHSAIESAGSAVQCARPPPQLPRVRPHYSMRPACSCMPPSAAAADAGISPTPPACLACSLCTPVGHTLWNSSGSQPAPLPSACCDWSPPTIEGAPAAHAARRDGVPACGVSLHFCDLCGRHCGCLMAQWWQLQPLRQSCPARCAAAASRHQITQHQISCVVLLLDGCKWHVWMWKRLIMGPRVHALWRRGGGVAGHAPILSIYVLTCQPWRPAPRTFRGLHKPRYPQAVLVEQLLTRSKFPAVTFAMAAIARAAVIARALLALAC